MTRERAHQGIARRDATIQNLTKLLGIERRINAALSNLAFLPATQQNPAKLKELRKVTTIKRKLLKASAPHPQPHGADE